MSNKLDRLPCPACGELPFNHPRAGCGLEAASPEDVVCAALALQGRAFYFMQDDVSVDFKL